MAYDFKKLKDVTTVEEVTNKANVLIEEDGIIKKVNKNEISGLKEVSWNDLKDKPFNATIETSYALPETLLFGIPDEEYNRYWLSGDGNGEIGQIPYLRLKPNVEYTVALNGKKYKVTSEIVGDNWTQISFLCDDSYIDITSFHQYGYTRILYSDSFGEQITLAIYEEKEIVEPLDYKYMPEGYPSVKTKVVEIVPETEVVITEANGSKTLEGDISPMNEGETYIVHCDGVEYSCVARFNVQGGEANVIGFGNGTVFDQYWEVVEDVPFYFLSTYDDTLRNRVHFAEPGTHTFSISQEREVAIPMDSRFIPSSMGAPLVLDADNPDGYNNYDYFINKEFVDYFFEYGVIPPVSIISTEGSGKLLWTPEFFIQYGRGGVRIDAYNRATEYNNQKSVCVVKDEESALNPYGN